MYVHEVSKTFCSSDRSGSLQKIEMIQVNKLYYQNLQTIFIDREGFCFRGATVSYLSASGDSVTSARSTDGEKGQGTHRGHGQDTHTRVEYT